MLKFQKYPFLLIKHFYNRNMHSFQLLRHQIFYFHMYLYLIQIDPKTTSSLLLKNVYNFWFLFVFNFYLI